MPTRAKIISRLVLAAVLMTAVQPAGAQSGKGTATAGAEGKAHSAGDDTLDRAKILRAAADALGMVRWSDIGAGTTRLPAIDVVNHIEYWGSGTSYGPGPSSKPGQPMLEFKTEYHASLGYNPPAMRVEMTRTPAQGGGTPLHTIQVVREKYSWDESEIGAGLIPGKGTATSMMSAANNRFLQLWIFPYGVIKSALAAGDKTKVSTENGTTIITFPLTGQLAGVIVKATLDAQNRIAKVETRSDDPALTEMLTETEYSDYADHGEIATDIKSPGHIVRKQGGRPLFDIQVKMLDANNPYLVFPVPQNVKTAATN